MFGYLRQLRDQHLGGLTPLQKDITVVRWVTDKFGSKGDKRSRLMKHNIGSELNVLQHEEEGRRRHDKRKAPTTPVT